MRTVAMPNDLSLEDEILIEIHSFVKNNFEKFGHKKINNTYVTIAQRRTDVTGGALFNLIIENSYKIIASKSGYITSPAKDYVAKAEVNCAQYGCINLYLIESTSSQNSYLGVSIVANIPAYSLPVEALTFSATILDSSNTLEYYGIAATNYNGVETKQNITGNPSGGIVTITMNISNNTNIQIPVGLWYKVSNAETFRKNYLVYIRSYNITNTNNITLNQTFADSKQYLSRGGEISLAVFIIIIILMFLGIEAQLNPNTLAIVALIGITIFTYFEYIPSILGILAGIIIVYGWFDSSRNQEGVG